jgi:hypothetical protein
MARARWIVKENPFETVTRQVCRDITDEDLKHDAAPVPVAPPVIPPQALPPVPVQPVYKPYDELYILATAACLNPNGLTDNEVRRHLDGFPDGKTYSLSYGNIPQGCVKDLFLELMQFNAAWSRNTLSRDWLVGEATRLNQQHAPPPSYSDDDDRRRSGPVYSGPCGNGGSLCGSNRPHF